MTTYRVEVYIKERFDCEPFRSTDEVGAFVIGKLIEGTFVDVPLIVVAKENDK